MTRYRAAFFSLGEKKSLAVSEGMPGENDIFVHRLVGARRALSLTLQDEMSPDTILAIEDNPDDLFFLKRAFKESGLTNPLEIARDGEAGFAFLKQRVEEAKVTGNLVLPLFV